MSDIDMIRATQAYIDLIDTCKLHITEHEFNNVLGNACRQAFDDVPHVKVNSSFNAAMGWWHKKREAFKTLLKEDGITVHWNDEFEREFKEWYDNQPDPGILGIAGLQRYSEKRKEFEALYKQKMKEIGFE